MDDEGQQRERSTAKVAWTRPQTQMLYFISEKGTFPLAKEAST